MRISISCLWISVLVPATGIAQTPAGVPVFKIIQQESSVKFKVNASVEIAETFDRWNATVTFTSPAYDAAVLDVKIQADSVNTGSGVKDGKLKSKDFFDVKDSPLITFHSTKVVQSGPNTVEFDGRLHDSRRDQA